MGTSKIKFFRCFKLKCFVSKIWHLFRNEAIKSKFHKLALNLHNTQSYKHKKKKKKTAKLPEPRDILCTYLSVSLSRIS